jgi:type II secretory ATPase GspE/PulE/Tfp pilus assembly ATPase PilB-like protein
MDDFGGPQQPYGSPGYRAYRQRKTTTLYSALNHLNKPDANIMTAEPGQVQFRGISRSGKGGDRPTQRPEVVHQAGPDIVMVGEIRDFETAELALKYIPVLVLALFTETRSEHDQQALEYGYQAFLVSSALILIVEGHQEEYAPSAKWRTYSPPCLQNQLFGEAQRIRYTGARLPVCNNTGFKEGSRYEVMLVRTRSGTDS